MKGELYTFSMKIPVLRQGAIGEHMGLEVPL